MNKLHNHLSHLYLFYNVARLGSFQAVATKYNLPRSSVSKKIQQLEEQVGQRLIQRSTRKLSLTDAGRDLLAASASLSKVVESSQRVIEKHESTLSGTVKISCTVIIGEKYLLPLMHSLREEYPAISLELYFNDDPVDLLAQEIDIAIRIGHLPDSSLMARKICDKRLGWFASPGYLEKHGTPATPDDLTEHQCVIFKNQSITLDHWSFKQTNGDIIKVRAQNNIATDNGHALVEMARMGLGVIMIDAILIKDDIENGTLVPILTDWQHPDTLPINLVCLGRNYRSRASTTIWEALFEHLQKVLS
ncbi:LysR family transcriptional regulator [Psychromonas algicola]|uniref:LysR family transcriptional regulator n=1 Tax=Psychromonas algicola TaxID=2555642 RepID=UPI0010676A04|nr:LysR family transcriptional regulator [Psychromonas sp. RZ5]TEW52021.1 LysR family transcriptional regulator [Psychromonas sp. RZ5]